MGSPDERALSKEQLEQLLGRRVKRPCPICEGATWDVPETITVVLPTQDDPNGPIKIVHEADEGFVSSGIVTLPMVCRNCGFIAQFAYEQLRNEARE